MNVKNRKKTGLYIETLLILSILFNSCWGIETLNGLLIAGASDCLLTNGFTGAFCSTFTSCLTRFGPMALLRSNCTCPVKTCGLVNFRGCPLWPGTLFEYGT